MFKDLKSYTDNILSVIGLNRGNETPLEKQYRLLGAHLRGVEQTLLRIGALQKKRKNKLKKVTIFGFNLVYL